MPKRLLLALAALVLAPCAHAQKLASHSVSYEVKLAPDADKNAFAEGQGSYSLTRSCQGWTLGEVQQFGIEKGVQGAPKALGQKGDRLEERLTVTEALDGSRLAYKTQLRLNARISIANGKGTIGPDGGRLSADLGTYTQDSDLPAGTLTPAAARAALLDALLANQPDPIEIKTVEIMRFHKPIVERFQRLPPTDTTVPLSMPKELKSSDKEFLKGRAVAVRRRVGDFNEFGDEFWLLHESGVVLRRLTKRQNVSLQLEAREVTLFPTPKCD